MNTSLTKRPLILLACMGLIALLQPTDAPAAEGISLAAAAKAILHSRCFACHGEKPDALKGSLNIEDYAMLMDPARKLVVPSDADASEIFRRVIKGQMPKGKPALAASEQNILRAWIAAGAPSFDTPSGTLVVNDHPGDLPTLQSDTTQPVAPVAKPVTPNTVATNPKTTGTPTGPAIAKTTTPGPVPGPAPGPATGPVPPVSGGPPGGAPAELTSRVKQIFTDRCLKCHGGKETEGGIKILDRDLVISKKKIVPGKASESTLFKLVAAKSGDMMPPEEFPRLTDAQIADIREWISAGAPAWGAAGTAVASVTPGIDPGPAPKIEEKPRQGHLGVEYILQSIHNDIRHFKSEDRRYMRYFSLTHILDGGATDEELNLQRLALIKAINSLTWAPTIVQPKAIEPTFTIYRVDLRLLGWEKRVYDKTPGAYGDFTLYDLVLLEYPYGIIHENSDAYLGLVRDYFPYAKPVRPIAFVRADWFVSTATLPPLYHDILQLPQKVEDLEAMLNVNAYQDLQNYRAPRAGMTDSGVSRNNRVVERHQARFGDYWKSFDFKTSSEQESMMKNPIDLHQTGGEMVFNLPNGLQGYYVANAKGQRIDAAPTEIVVDKNASDKIVRNGLSCIRCHTDGIKTFKDAVRPTLQSLSGSSNFSLKAALALYPSQKVMDGYVDADTKRFLGAVEKAFGKPQTVEPLTPVSLRFIDHPVGLNEATAEAGLPDSKNLRAIFRLPQFADLGLAPLALERTVHRDSWQTYYDRVVRQLGIGVPMVPLDGLTLPNYEPSFPAPFHLTVKTNKSGNQYSPEENLELKLKADYDIYVEVIVTGSYGTKSIWVPSSTKIKSGEEFKYPAKGQTLKMPKTPGKLEITVFASTAPFPSAEILRSSGVTDRIAHPFKIHYKSNHQYEITFSPDPLKTVKKTLELEIK